MNAEARWRLEQSGWPAQDGRVRIPARMAITIVAAFVAGGLSVWLAVRPAPPPAAGGVSLFPAKDAGAGPRIVIDPDSIQLLPDASLRLDLPPGFDDGGGP